MDWTYEAVTYYTANDTPAVPPFVHRPRTDPLNYAYAGHCIGSPYDWQPDCGHADCGILCDVAIEANRRAEMADLCR